MWVSQQAREKLSGSGAWGCTEVGDVHPNVCAAERRRLQRRSRGDRPLQARMSLWGMPLPLGAARGEDLDKGGEGSDDGFFSYFLRNFISTLGPSKGPGEGRRECSSLEGRGAARSLCSIVKI